MGKEGWGEGRIKQLFEKRERWAGRIQIGTEVGHPSSNMYSRPFQYVMWSFFFVRMAGKGWGCYFRLRLHRLFKWDRVPGR